MKFGNLLKKIITEEKIATTVDVGGQEETGGFCEHNPAINKFAFENPVHMFMVLAFVLFTMQKPWSVVTEGFIEFLTWWFTDAASKLQQNPSRTDIEYPKNASYSKYVNRFGENNSFMIGFWNNRVKIFEDLKALKEGTGSLDKDAKVIITNLAGTFKNKNQSSQDKEVHDSILLSLEDTLNSPEYLVFRYLCGLSGLGTPKAGFVTQLLLGKMGCVDSVNTNIYKSFFPSATWDAKGKNSAKSVGLERSGKMKGKFSNPTETKMAGYAYFLNYLQHMYSNDKHVKDVSRMMWDDWCEIIARKMIYATNKGGLKDQQIFIKHITGGGATIDPYQHDKRSGAGIDKWKQQTPSGFRVSKEHETSFTNARDIAAQARSQFPESKQFMNDEEALFEMYKKMYNEETEEPKKVEPKKVVSKKSSKQEPVKQTGEYLEITVPDKV